MDFLHLIWLIPALPLLGAALNGVLGPRAPKAAIIGVGVGAPLLSLFVALGCLWQYTTGVLYPDPYERILYTWASSFGLDVAFLLDPLSAVMLFVVTFVGFWIHVYSVGYMGHEGGFQRFFVYLNLFMGAMLLLILGNNFLVSFVGWEGVGLCSYLLIGFYYDQDFPPYAGKKAFIVNRVGDFGFLLGVFALASTFGTVRYTEIFSKIAADPSLVTGPYAIGLSLASFAALCLFIGAMGKSAQIPLYVWLPDAMAGPTPVSALIHAATMVTAGVYIVVRSNVLFQLAPGVSLFVATIGAATALLAATIGLAQNDIKKVLAYSTVSQLGYMFLAAGVGAYGAAVFHLGTHAFFKALLFLGSGSVIHAMSGEQDMRKMGGLKKHLPKTYWTFVIGTLAIAGVPGLAGFFSKDAILAGAFAAHRYELWVLGLFTAGLTACYMFRAVHLTFHGEFRGTPEQEHHLHESPAVMIVPLIVLAVGAVAAGWVGIPGHNLFERFLSPVIARLPGASEHPHPSVLLEVLLIGASVAAALLGIWLATRLWGAPRGLAGDDALATRFGGLMLLFAAKYWVDELYDRIVVKPLAWIAKVCWKVVDVLLIDGSVHVGAFLAEITGDLGRLSTTGNVRNYGLFFFVGVVALLCWMVF